MNFYAYRVWNQCTSKYSQFRKGIEPIEVGTYDELFNKMLLREDARLDDDGEVRLNCGDRECGSYENGAFDFVDCNYFIIGESRFESELYEDEYEMFEIAGII